MLPHLNAQHQLVYNNLAEEYWKQREEQEKSLVANLAPYFENLRKNNCSTVLDVACGVGTSTKILQDFGFAATGIDFSESMVYYANQQANSVYQQDFFTMNGKFDSILMIAFIHLFPSPIATQALAKCKELLKPQGILHLVTTASKKCREGFFPKQDYPKSQMRFRKYWTKEKLFGLLKENNWIIINSYTTTGIRGKTWLHVTLKS